MLWGAGLSSSWGARPLTTSQKCYLLPSVPRAGQGAPERQAGSTFSSFPDLAQGQVWTQRASENTRDAHSRHQVDLALIINNSKY